MAQYAIWRIREHAEWIPRAGAWFHAKWRIPESAYVESMRACLRAPDAVPQWYIVVEAGEIVAGIGVIDNDFHDRKDLAPNVCAVYVEEAYRNQGIAGAMLGFVCEDMRAMGVDTLYLLTDHTSFYERYGWRFLCMAQGDNDAHRSRVYVHTATET